MIRGSQEAFTESEKINVALIRKRLRDSRMKVEEQTVGVRSHTMTALVYMEDLIYQGLLTTMKQQLLAVFRSCVPWLIHWLLTKSLVSWVWSMEPLTL